MTLTRLLCGALALVALAGCGGTVQEQRDAALVQTQTWWGGYRLHRHIGVDTVWVYGNVVVVRSEVRR